MPTGCQPNLSGEVEGVGWNRRWERQVEVTAHPNRTQHTNGRGGGGGGSHFTTSLNAKGEEDKPPTPSSIATYQSQGGPPPPSCLRLRPPSSPCVPPTPLVKPHVRHRLRVNVELPLRLDVLSDRGFTFFVLGPIPVVGGLEAMLRTGWPPASEQVVAPTLSDPMSGEQRGGGCDSRIQCPSRWDPAPTSLRQWRCAGSSYELQRVPRIDILSY